MQTGKRKSFEMGGEHLILLRSSETRRDEDIALSPYKREKQPYHNRTELSWTIPNAWP